MYIVNAMNSSLVCALVHWQKEILSSIAISNENCVDWRGRITSLCLFVFSNHFEEISKLAHSNFSFDFSAFQLGKVSFGKRHQVLRSQ